MEIKGNRKINAPRQQVFQALLTPEVLKNSIPGCELAELVAGPTGQQLRLVVSPNFPGFKGPYTILVQLGDVIPPSRVTLITEPSNSMGSVKATCVIDLVEEAPAITNLNYNAVATTTGKIAAIPEMMVKGAVKSGLDQFFKNFEKQVSTVAA